MFKKIMKAIFMNKLMMKFWIWRYDRKMAKFNLDEYLKSGN